jgi:hypothetical protein
MDAKPLDLFIYRNINVKITSKLGARIEVS